MMKLVSILLAFVILLVEISPSTRGFNEAQATPFVAVAPVAAIGSLQALAATAAGAASIGIITAAQNEDVQRDIQRAIESVGTATDEAIQGIVAGVIAAWEFVSGGGDRQCDHSSTAVSPTARNRNRRGTGGVDPTPNGAAAALVSTTEGTRPRVEQCRGGVRECCHDYMQKFGARIQQRNSRRAPPGYLVYEINPNGTRQVSCCMEWDRTHGGFEVFRNRGRQHLGERGCDDLADDPCARTAGRGSHAQSARASHQPRSAACQAN
jgi:hypothetical protein